MVFFVFTCNGSNRLIDGINLLIDGITSNRLFDSLHRRVNGLNRLSHGLSLLINCLNRVINGANQLMLVSCGKNPISVLLWHTSYFKLAVSRILLLVSCPAGQPASQPAESVKIQKICKKMR